MSSARPLSLLVLLLRIALSSARPLRVLYESWLYIPHSYAIVSAYELLHLQELYGPNGSVAAGRLELRVREPPYFRPQWAAKRCVCTGEAA